jgi:hypothetical protein
VTVAFPPGPHDPLAPSGLPEVMREDRCVLRVQYADGWMYQVRVKTGDQIAGFLDLIREIPDGAVWLRATEGWSPDDEDQHIYLSAWIEAEPVGA